MPGIETSHLPGILGYLSSPFVERALITSVLIAINAGIAGSFATFRNSVFLIAGSAHAALAGAAGIILLQYFGILAGVDPMIGGSVTAILLALLAAKVSLSGKRGDVDSAIGVGFAFSMAIAVLLISMIPESASRVWSILIGDLLLVTWSDIRLLLVSTVIVVFFFVLYRREFLFITFDSAGARAFGVRAEFYNYAMYGLIGLSVASFLKGIGELLVFAMMVAPAAAAILLAGSVRGVITLSIIIAFASGLLGIIISYYLNISASAITAFIASGSYFLAIGYIRFRDRK